jgi:hypothetical protein
MCVHALQLCIHNHIIFFSLYKIDHIYFLLIIIVMI